MSKFDRDCMFYMVVCYATVAYLTVLCAFMIAVAMM